MNKNIILQHYYYSRKKIISKRWCPGLIDERNIGKCLHSSSVGAHSLNLIVQYELIRLLKYWWVTSLKTLPWILWCVRTVRRLRVTQTCTWAGLEHWWGLHTLRWQQGERFRSSSAQESLISKIFHNRTVFFFTSCPEKGYPATSEHWAPSHWISCDCMNFMSCSDRFNLFSF